VAIDTERRKKNPFTDTSFLIFTGLALVAASLCFVKGQDVFCQGWDFSIDLFLEIMPRMIAAFIVAGFIEAMVPKDFITRWIGEKSGLKGIFIAEVAGILTPGGPIICFPMVVVLVKNGAAIPPLVAFLTAWSVFAFHRIIAYEIPLLGVRFATLRILSSLVLPPLAGFQAALLETGLGGGI
jgi:uncharacterized protein